MLIIFTGEKDEKKLTSKQNLFVERKKKKKKNEKAGGKQLLNVDKLTSCLVFCT